MIVDKNNIDVIGVIENYLCGMVVNFYCFDIIWECLVGLFIFVKIWIMEDGWRWDYKEVFGIKLKE